MGIKLYYAPMSSSTRVLWALEELGIPFEKVRVNLAEGEQRKPEYLALNPNGKVPTMVVDGTVVFESLAMLIYLGETHGVSKALYPAPGIERAEALKWIAWGTVTLVGTVADFLKNTSDRFPAEQRNAKAAEAARAEIGTLLGILDTALKGKDYILGGGFTLVDLSLVAMMPFMARLGIDFNPYATLNAWLARCMARPALARAMAG